jgi:hypothetical protein
MANIKKLLAALPPGKLQTVKDISSLISARITEAGHPRRIIRVSLPRGEYDSLIKDVIIALFIGEWHVSVATEDGAVKFTLVPKVKE